MQSKQVVFLAAAVSIAASPAAFAAAAVKVTSVEQRGARLLHEEHHELRWVRRARVPSNNVDIIRPFVEALTRRECHFMSTSYLHDDAAFQHIQKGVCIMAMDLVYTAGWILHGDHQTFFAGNQLCGFRLETSR